MIREERKIENVLIEKKQREKNNGNEWKREDEHEHSLML